MATIVVGLDFGTHSTKILARRRGGSESSIVTLQPPVEGYPWFACPSLIRVTNGKVYFGADALSSSHGTLLSSMKLELLPNLNQLELAHKNHYPTSTNAEIMAAIFLSWCMQQVTQLIEQRLGLGHTIFFNVGAPMSQYENQVLSDQYLRILNAAWNAARFNSEIVFESGMSLNKAAKYTQSWIRDDVVVPSRDARVFHVLPETVAPIISLCHDPRMIPGMYLLVDIGAGTTEVSINLVRERGSNEVKSPILCYFDKSILLGGNHFGNQRLLPKDLVGRLVKLTREVWARGYEKDYSSRVARDKWRQLQVVFTGGAARRGDIQEAINENNEIIYPWPWDEICYETNWHYPTGLSIEGSKLLIQSVSESISDAATSSLSMLAVAHGLSIERRHWNEFCTPFEIAPIPPINMNVHGLEYGGQTW